VLVFVAFGATSAPASAGSGDYIVVVKDSSDPGAVAADHARRYGAQAKRLYTSGLKGYAGAIPRGRVDDVRADSRVSYVERDAPVHSVSQTIPWGISKVGATVSPTALAGNGSGTVPNVTASVIDTGIASHTDLNIRTYVNYAGGQSTDCNGHGTHVSGTIAARDNTQYVVGVAPGIPLVSVKVLGCSGSGWTSNVISGVNYVTSHVGSTPGRDVANMSLGGGASKALDDAVKSSVAAGATYSIAAGNEGANACNSSPARTGTTNGVITTAATDSADREASWSNYGSCVDIWAPGVSILSTWKNGGTATLSGTSMAAPHVGGGAALYLATHAASPATTESALKSAARLPGTKSKDGRSISRLYVGGF